MAKDEGAEKPGAENAENPEQKQKQLYGMSPEIRIVLLDYLGERKLKEPDYERAINLRVLIQNAPLLNITQIEEQEVEEVA